jgi:hypothetical protein
MVNGNNSVKGMDRGPQFTSGVSHKVNNMLGKQITVEQLI